MDTRRSLPDLVSVFFIFLLAACTSAPSGTPYLPPSPVQNATPPPTATLFHLTVEVPPDFSCTDSLAFVDDLTIPDNTVVAPGTLLDKQWLVRNTGTCNWDSRYRLRFVGGYTLGANEEYALYPARADAQATLRILFTAPTEAGEFVSVWQALDPDGLPFGEAFLIKVIVQP